jgi:hypothetical protein
MGFGGGTVGVKVSEVMGVSGQMSDEREGAVLREALIPFGMPLVQWRWQGFRSFVTHGRN